LASREVIRITLQILHESTVRLKAGTVLVAVKVLAPDPTLPSLEPRESDEALWISPISGSTACARAASGHAAAVPPRRLALEKQLSNRPL